LKVYISVDIEGVSGVTDTAHTSASGNDYQLARRLMTWETNAAVEGALDAGAEEIIVNDGHGGNGNRNILLTELNEEARLLTGRPKDLSQLALLDSSYDAVLLVGYHVRADSYGVISHSINGPVVNEIRVNDRPVGEIGLNAYLAGHCGVPVVMVSGDQFTAQETSELLPWARTAIVKEAVGHNAALCLHPNKAQALIRHESRLALEQLESMKSLEAELPARFELFTKGKAMADIAQDVPGFEHVGPRRLQFVATQSFLEGYRTLVSAIGLAMRTAILPG